jgi:imidazolonepropionase-like amidohydrolase
MCQPIGRGQFIAAGAGVVAMASVPFRAVPSTLGDAFALTGAKVYPSPAAEPLRDGTILVQNGKILAVGATAEITVPSGFRRVACISRVITAGFQNSHCHFTESQWSAAADAPAATLTAQLQKMLTKYGFTTVVDTASLLTSTSALRRRVDSWEVFGPRILTAGKPLFPANGVPYYVRDSVPAELLRLLEPPASATQAVALVRDQSVKGADIVKLFTGSYIDRNTVLPMPIDIARAATAEAHRLNRLTFSHESSVAGLEIALEAQVDVLAHAVEDTRGFTPEHQQRMLEQKMAVIPTLTLYGSDTHFDRTLAALRDFARAGGDVMFGTDVGYLPEAYYNPTREYELMARAGLGWKDILASLTTVPSARFNESSVRGRIAPGMNADLVVLGADPANDVRAFADVRFTIRAGRLIYETA